MQDEMILKQENEHVMKKREVSNILRDSRNWHNADDIKPGMDQPVVIRIVNDNVVYQENDTEIMYAEDMKLAKFVRSVDNENEGQWLIIPPYPKYDKSYTSEHERIKDGVEVTHWADATEEEIASWNSRFNILGDYHDFYVHVDEEHEKTLYDALCWAYAIMHRTILGEKATTGEEDEEAVSMQNMILDMINMMDKNIGIINGEEIISSTINERCTGKTTEEKQE